MIHAATGIDQHAYRTLTPPHFRRWAPPGERAWGLTCSCRTGSLFWRLGGLWLHGSLGARCPRLAAFFICSFCTWTIPAPSNRNERHFVLSGIAVYERQFSYITDEIFEKIEFDQKSRAP